MRPHPWLGTGLLCLSLLLAGRGHAGPETIPEAPLDDEPADTVAATSAPAAVYQSDPTGPRLYWIATFDYSPEKSLPQNSPLRVLQDAFPSQDGNLELNGEWSGKLRPDLFFKADLQADYSPEIAEETSGRIHLNQFFFDFRPASGLSLLLGKYRRIFGPGIFQNPMDRYTPASFLPGQPLQRDGVYLAQASWTVNPNLPALTDMSLTAAFLPGFLTNDYGLPVGEQSYTQWSPQGACQTDATWSAANLGGFVRWYGNLEQGDANAMVYYYESQWQLGCSYGKYVLPPWLELHAEGLAYRQPHDVADAGDHPYWDALAGFRIEPWDRAGVIVEWIHWSERPAALPAGVPDQMRLMNYFLRPGSRLTPEMPFENYLAVTAFGPTWTDRLDTRANVIIHPTSGDALWTLRNDWAMNDRTKLAVTAMAVSGANGGYYRSAIPFEWRISTEVWAYF